MDAHHEPVLLRECLDWLQPERGGLFLDATVGLGGHAEALLEASSEVRLLGIDRDPEALEIAARHLTRFGARVHLVEGNFHHLAELVGGVGERFAGALADLGVSSLQLERPRRGFSFRHEGPLDMRMGGGDVTAADVVNLYSEAELEQILREYGEERAARRIARAIAARRAERPFGTTTELRELIHRVKGRRPERGRETRIDPATRAFQALRIEVNQELAGLARFLEEAVERLEGQGRLVVISYHSLEDRIVKNTLRELARGEIDPVTGRPRAETQVIEVLTKKPVRPSAEEVSRNPRSRSARLRAVRRLPRP